MPDAPSVDPAAHARGTSLYGTELTRDRDGQGVAPGHLEDTTGHGLSVPQVEREFTVKARSQREMVTRRFIRHRLAMGSLIIFIGLVLLSLLGPLVWHYSYSTITNDFSQSPSWNHPFGTDGSGHDAFAQVLRGAQKSVEIALLVAVLSTTLGATVGLVAGYYRGWVDTLLMRIVDLLLTVPAIAVTGVLAYNLGNVGWFAIALVLASLFWAPIARVTRGVTLSLREKEYVEAARALGASDRWIIFRHLLPNCLGSIIVNATIAVAFAILAETGLSFLGVGVQAPDTSLGLLVSTGVSAAQTRPWLFYFPGLFIIIIALTINFVGDGLRDAFDPTQTKVRA